MAQMKREILIILPENAYGIWDIIGDLQTLEETEAACFHHFTLLKLRSVRLLSKPWQRRPKRISGGDGSILYKYAGCDTTPVEATRSGP
jgi:hypothetical protein